MAIAPADILVDTAERLISRGVEPQTVWSVLSEVRALWAGQIYLPKSDPRRDQQIREQLQAGVPPREVARAVGVSKSTVLRRRSTWL